MTVLVWIAEGIWQAAVDAARAHAGTDEVVLLHVSDDDVPGVAHGAFAGLLGRGRRGRDPGRHIADLAATSGAELLAAAADRLDRPARLEQRHGRVEREVVAAAEGAALLVVARDGDPARLGPHSLRPHARFVVDHAPCPVLLVWPHDPPAVADIPPPPQHPPHEHPHHPPSDAPHHPPPEPRDDPSHRPPHGPPPHRRHGSLGDPPPHPPHA